MHIFRSDSLVSYVKSEKGIPVTLLVTILKEQLLSAQDTGGTVTSRTDSLG